MKNAKISFLRRIVKDDEKQVLHAKKKFEKKSNYHETRNQCQYEKPEHHLQKCLVEYERRLGSERWKND